MADQEAAKPSLVALINPSDNRIYSVSAGQADKYKEAGWAAPDLQPEIRRQEIDTALSSWKDYVPAVAMQVVRGVPFATTVLSKTLDDKTFHYLAEQSKAFEEQHGFLAAGLAGAGGIASIAAASSGLGALGGALGIGAEAAGLGAEAATAGAEAAGGLAEGLGLGGRAAAGAADAAAGGAADTAVGSALQGGARAATGEAGLAAETAAVEPQALMRTATAPSADLASAGETGLARYQAPVEGILEDAPTLASSGSVAPKAAQSITDAEFYDPAQRLLGPAPGLGAEAGGLGAEAAAGGAGEASVGAEAASAGLGSRLTSLLPKGSLARTALGAAAESAAYGAVYRIDNAAIEHALQPEGQEKLLFSANDILLDAALGAAIPVGLKGLGKVLGGTGKKIEGGAIDMFRNAVMHGDAMEAVKQQGRWGDLKETIDPLIGMNNRQIAAHLHTEWKLGEQGLQTIKDKYSTLDGNKSTGLLATMIEKQDVLDAIKPILGPNMTKAYKMTYKAFKGHTSLDTIQKLANDIKKGIVWTASFEPGSKNAMVREAYEEVVKLGSTMLKRVQKPGTYDHIQWESFNKQYSNNILAHLGLRDKNAQGLSDVISRMGTAAAVGGAMGGFGLAGGGIAAAALKTGSWSVVHHIKGEHLAPFANKVGKGLQAADRRIGNALEAGLYGLAGQVSKATNPLRFDDAAATVALAASNPAKAIENLQTVMDQQGVPQEISVPLVQKQVAGLTHLHKSRPVRNDAPDVVTDDQGDPVQNHRWLDQVHTFKDPSHGITYPTADNLKILKQFYPEVLYTAQQAALQQISKDPNLPLESKMWASQLLERPISNLTSPTFAQTLNAARKQANEATQPKQPGSSKSQNAVQSTLSRADALQNRE